MCHQLGALWHPQSVWLCHWGLLTLQSFTSGPMFSGRWWLVSNFFSTWNLPSELLWLFPLLSYQLSLPALPSNVFWFLTTYLPWPAPSLLKSFLPDLLLMLMLNQGSFIKSGNTLFQGRTGSTHLCPYSIPVKGTTWWVLTKSTIKCFLPHSNLAKKKKPNCSLYGTKIIVKVSTHGSHF